MDLSLYKRLLLYKNAVQYTHAREKRIMIQTLNSIRWDQCNTPPPPLSYEQDQYRP